MVLVELPTNYKSVKPTTYQPTNCLRINSSSVAGQPLKTLPEPTTGPREVLRIFFLPQNVRFFSINLGPGQFHDELKALTCEISRDYPSYHRQARPYLPYFHIRLVKAYRNDTTGLKFSFVHMPLDVQPFSHRALSYRWTIPPKYGKCDDGRFLDLTTSAAAAILIIGTAGEIPRYFFINLFCINQDDREEKSHQVQMIGEIFATAEKIMVWLDRPSFQPAAVAVRIAVFGPHQLNIIVEGDIPEFITLETTLANRYF
ncbi:hypothetical protein MMC12_000071 [Toensbergia leucococca]|nr:hypothetical protein [Toensbergia leucococca]